MLLRKVYIENFRSIKQLELEFAPLTILIGPNNSGKTDIIRAIQTPLIARFEGIERRELTYDLGTFKDIVYNHNVNTTINVKYEFQHVEGLSTINLRLGTSNGIDVVRESISINLNFHGNVIEFHLDLHERKYLILKSKDILVPTMIPSELESLISPFKRGLDTKSIIATLPVEFPAILKMVHSFLGLKESNLESKVPFHEIFKIHFLTLSDYEQLIHDLYLSVLLGSSNRLIYSRYIRPETQVHRLLIESIEQYSQEISRNISIVLEFPVELSVKRLSGDVYEIILNRKNIVDLGLGVSYLLPLTILAVLVKKIYVVEEPELHLHPKAQANFVNLILNLLQRDIQIIIETHSEHVLSRVCRCVAEGRLSRDDVKIYYVRMTDEGTRVKEVKIDDIGRLLELPDFYEFDILELISTLKARGSIKLTDIEELIKIYKSRIEAGDTHLADIVEVLELLLKIGKVINSGNFEDVKHYLLSKVPELRDVIDYIERLLKAYKFKKARIEFSEEDIAKIIKEQKDLIEKLAKL